MYFIKMYLVFTVTFSRPGERSGWKKGPGRDGGGVDGLLDNGDRKRKPASEGEGEQSTLSAFYELEQGIERGNKLVKQASLSLSQLVAVPDS